MRAPIAFAVLCLLLAVSSRALAAGPADLGLAFQTAVKDDGQPALVLRPRVGIREATLTITGPDGAPRVTRLGAIGRGATRRVPVDHPAGRASYQGRAEVRWADGQAAEYTFTFDAVRYRSLKLTMTWEDFDLERRVATCLASHEVASIEVALEASDGRELARGRRDYDPPAPGGEALSVSWEPLPHGEAPARVTVKVTDALGVWASMRATPFTIHIPHDEVEFASGDATIRASEIPKLEKTLDDMKRALRQHGTLLDLKLFIAGMTDTVGSAEMNMALSARRAEALARWFRKRGVRLGIYYRGFGEAMPAVATPDETEAPENRRALYILSVHPPLGVRVARGEGAEGWARL
ncbi:MAG: OmpA family protein [Deltaproteobacteria bacterium]|nr:OmpA family protein [Deltaproteobacteria bacterium]